MNVFRYVYNMYRYKDMYDWYFYYICPKYCLVFLVPDTLQPKSTYRQRQMVDW